MSTSSIVVQQSPTERPTRHHGPVCLQPTPVFLPSMVEAMGRTTVVAYSANGNSWLVGADVAPPQRWKRGYYSFTGYAAGLGSGGSNVSFQNKKTCGLQESASYAVALMGANGGGCIARRAVGAPFWSYSDFGFWGNAQDGGSSDPRRTGARLVLIDGTTSYVACERAAAPTNVIARSTNSGVSFTAWETTNTRNFTALVKSPQYSAIYASADGRVGSSADGVFIITGLGSSSVLTRIDNVGTGAPTLLDVRDVIVVQEGTTDTIFVVCGNKAGSDADRGVWRCRIPSDPSAGGFLASSVTWTHILTTGSADRPQSVDGYKPNGSGAGPIYIWLNYFKSSTVATGTYTLSTGAGGGSKNCMVTAQRTLNADAASPAWDVVSNGPNVDMTTVGTPHAHVMSYCGEPSTENARFGGSNYAGAGTTISSDGQTIVTVGSATPWRCDNPWLPVPIVRPFSRGLGALENAYSSVHVPESDKTAVSDIDRGMFTWKSAALGYEGPEWVISADVGGIAGTSNEMNYVSLSVDETKIYSARSADGRAWLSTNPWNRATASAALVAPDTSAGTAAIGVWQWTDSTSTNRVLIATLTGAWRGTTKVLTYASSASRCDFRYDGVNCWLHIPDLGIYRSNDDGVTWSLWWNNAITNGLTQRMCGHIAVSAVTSNVLFVTFDSGGVWRCTNADGSTNGSGIAGSRPGETNLITGGALPLGTEAIAAIDVDPYTGYLWAAGYVPAGGTLNGIFYRTPATDTWYQLDSTEWAESGILPEHIRVLDGQIICGTAFGTVRRLA